LAAQAREVGVDLVAKSSGLKHSSIERYLRMSRQTTGVEVKDAPVIGANTLLLDIETSPNVAYVWSCWKVNVAPSQLISTSEVLSWAAKWLGSSKVAFDCREGERTDKRLVQTMWNMIDRADVVVAHYGQGFDEKVLRTRWMTHGIRQPSPYKSIDTLRIAKDAFHFPSNKLDGIARYLGIGKKVEHEGFSLWTKCMADDHDAWRRMIKYNIGDVELLEQVYLRFRQWDKKHPNLALCFDDGDTHCVCCGGTRVKKVNKPSRTAVSVFGTYRCLDCGKMMRGVSRKHRDQVLRNVQ